MSDQELSQLLLQKLNLTSDGSVNSIEFAHDNQVDHQKVVGVVKSLQSLGDMIEADQVETKRFELSGEGKQIVASGSHEYVVWNAIPDGGIPQPDLMKSLPNANVAKLGFSKAMSNKWIAIDKSSGKPVVTKKCQQVHDEVKELLVQIDNASSDKVCGI